MEVTLTDIEHKRADIFGKVIHGHETVTVTRYGQPVATISHRKPRKSREEQLAAYDKSKMDAQTAAEVLAEYRAFKKSQV